MMNLRLKRAATLLAASTVLATQTAQSQDAALGRAASGATPLLELMVGTWDVQQQMWQGADVEAIKLPPAVAHRRLIANAYLEEMMEQAPKAANSPFTRSSYVNYNPIGERYEYFSLDSRAPQQMSYQSEKRDQKDTQPVKLTGGLFVAAKWGDATNVPFAYRLVIGEVRGKRQVVDLYLTPQSGSGGKEFLAFQYIYTRRP